MTKSPSLISARTLCYKSGGGETGQGCLVSMFPGKTEIIVNSSNLLIASISGGRPRIDAGPLAGRYTI